jgi:predicted regulator of Ras-like GTPase activity (Roadblock/LC7/MglB family)
MDNEFCASALKNTLDEMQRICPEIKATFVLDQNRKLIARGVNTPENTLPRALEVFDEVLEKAEAIGGVEALTVQGTDGRLSISYVDEVYLVTVTSKKADLNYVNTVTRVLVPTVLKLVEKIGSASIKRDMPTTEPELEAPAEVIEEPKASLVEETEPEKDEKEAEPEQKLDTTFTEPPVNQFIAEEIKGLLVSSDTVRIDNSVIEQWRELYEGREIEEADVETFAGKSLRCKVKPIKDGKFEGQGKIQLPNKLLLVLDIKKGELVRVKPAIE